MAAWAAGADLVVVVVVVDDDEEQSVVWKAWIAGHNEAYGYLWALKATR